MKNFIIYIVVAVLVVSCSGTIEKPKVLLAEDTMAHIIADFAINDQNYSVSSKIDNNIATKFILKQYKTSGDVFSASYKYYMLDPDIMANILSNAQGIILDKNPKAKDYILKKSKENPAIVPSTR